MSFRMFGANFCQRVCVVTLVEARGLVNVFYHVAVDG